MMNYGPHGQQDKQSAWVEGAALVLEDGTVQIPHALLRYYRSLRLLDTEAMLLLQLMAFRQQEHNEFPTLDELQSRMGLTADGIGKLLQKLIHEGWISIDTVAYEGSDVQYERYNLAGVYHKLATYLYNEQQVKRPTKDSTELDDLFTAGAHEGERNLFTIFEKEFGRPLSPMEYETIGGWIDHDQYPEELILLALKEAVFTGKVHFRYIDRILLEWNRNRIRTPEDAKAYAQKFRGGGR